MGVRYTVKCNKCGNAFNVSEGGGFRFHLLHCDRCGAEKHISFIELGETHIKYVKGLDMAYSSMSANEDKHIQDNYPGTSISEAVYNSEIEKLAGLCSCGGNYKMHTCARCPKCLSPDFTQSGDDRICYD